MRPATHVIAVLVLQGAMALPALAQTADPEPARIVAYGEAGFANLGGFDSEQGNAMIYGGEVQVRVRGPLHVAVDLGTNANEPTAGPFGRTSFRQTSLLISALAEWPSRARVRAMAGGGVGYLFVRSTSVVPAQAPGQVVTFRSQVTDGAFHGRGGIVGNVGKRLRVRGEALLAVGEGLSWIAGGRAAIGFAF